MDVLLCFEIATLAISCQTLYAGLMPWKQVDLAGDVPCGELRRLARCRVQARSSVWRVVAPAAIRSVGSRLPNLAMARFLTDQLERELAELAPRSATRRVEAWLTASGAWGASAATTARSLGLSRRTLARRLAEEGTTYRAVRDRLRLLEARRYLGARSVADVAETLGYADDRAFRRAFQRWTGVTPAMWIRRTAA